MSSNHPRDKHSPVAALASLEYLQNQQRRGSITDPALHATKFYRDDSHLTKHADIPDPRPSSPYVFGNATAHTGDQQPHGSQLRKLLHSPSTEHIAHRPSSSSLSHESPDHSRTQPGLGMSKEPNSMNVDNERHPFISRRSIRDPPSFDFNMRRHSIAVGQHPITLPHLSSTLGTKRKMSGDRSLFPPVGEDGDPQLVGPGVPSGMDIDADAPAPKRRGSTIDMQRIAQLSLNDRRSSVDSRGSWMNDRRESAPSLFPNVPSISSFNNPPPDAQHGRGPPSLSNFSWSPNSNNADPPNENSRQFDPMHPMNLVPPTNYLPDRRMSVPDALTHPSSSRNLRPLSRPPSRQGTDPQSSGQDEPSSASSPSHMKPGKDSGMTPYSRSPELRVSHKLAERKRRKEMKDLFDELRDQLPADRGMKASKWEILSKAIDFVAQLKRSHQEMAQELDMLRQQVHGQRPPEGLSVYPPPPGGGGGGGPPSAGSSSGPPVSSGPGGPPAPYGSGTSMMQPYSPQQGSVSVSSGSGPPPSLLQQQSQHPHSHPQSHPSSNHNHNNHNNHNSHHLGNDSRSSSSQNVNLFAGGVSGQQQGSANGHRADGSA